MTDDLGVLWLREPPAWQARAACAGMPLDLFFPIEEPPYYETVEAALNICAQCPVRPECLRYAMENNLSYGVWGGTSAGERARARRSARKQK